MIATYLTILIVSNLHGEGDYVAYAMHDKWACSDMLEAGGKIWAENDMMARCVETNILTSTSAPIPRPDNLMDAYNE